MRQRQESHTEVQVHGITRRHALQVAGVMGGGVLVVMALRSTPRASVLALNDHDKDEEDNSGRGRGRGRGRGGDDHHEDGDNDEENVTAIAAQVPAGAIEIRIVGDDAGDFVPGEVTIDLGQTIAFVNAHSDEHTATGSGFDTGIIPEGSVTTVVIEEPGTFAYACLIHPEMTGRVLVRNEDGVVPPPATPVPSASPVANAVEVRIANLAFEPAMVPVDVGATVTWTNDDTVPHTVTADDGAFDSGIFDPGASFSWTFEESGTIAYHCQLHPTMEGTIEVSG
jgi:plastocyanin